MGYTFFLTEMLIVLCFVSENSGSDVSINMVKYVKDMTTCYFL